MDRRTWWAIVYEVTRSRTWLSTHTLYIPLSLRQIKPAQQWSSTSSGTEPTLCLVWNCSAALDQLSINVGPEKRWLEKVCCELLWTVWPCWWGAREAEREQCRDRMWFSSPPSYCVLISQEENLETKRLATPLASKTAIHRATRWLLGLGQLGGKTSPIYC